MAIDHFAAAIIYYGILLPNAPLAEGTSAWDWYMVYKIMRFIGRSAFPVFCFLLVEGFCYTSNRKNYAVRLFLFALISEFPFDLALFGQPIVWEYQNVFFTLLIGLLVIWTMDWANQFSYHVILQAPAIACGCLLAWFMKTDYDYKGVILIVILYIFRYQPVLRTAAGCVSLLWEAPACLAFIPINLYNGKRGISLKYFFYLFYPVHLLIYAAILHFCF